MERRAAQDATAPEGLKSSQAVLEDRQLPLEQKKRKILRNLRTLEQAGLVSSSSRYQEVINDISKVSLHNIYKTEPLDITAGIVEFSKHSMFVDL